MHPPSKNVQASICTHRLALVYPCADLGQGLSLKDRVKNLELLNAEACRARKLPVGDANHGDFAVLYVF